MASLPDDFSIAVISRRFLYSKNASRIQRLQAGRGACIFLFLLFYFWAGIWLHRGCGFILPVSFVSVGHAAFGEPADQNESTHVSTVTSISLLCHAGPMFGLKISFRIHATYTHSRAMRFILKEEKIEPKDKVGFLFNFTKRHSRSS